MTSGIVVEDRRLPSFLDGTAKNIRSWSFNSNGGFIEGAWSRDGDIR